MGKIILSLCFLGLLMAGVARADDSGNTLAGSADTDTSNCHCYENHNEDNKVSDPAPDKRADQANFVFGKTTTDQGPTNTDQ